jgi:hypothetical protein
MEQIEDLDSYTCANSKRRMTHISIKEATRQQTKKRKIIEKNDARHKRRIFGSLSFYLFSIYIFLVLKSLAKARGET